MCRTAHLFLSSAFLKAFIALNISSDRPVSLERKLQPSRQGLVACSIDDDRTSGKLILRAIGGGAGEIGQSVLRATAGERYRDLAQSADSGDSRRTRVGAGDGRDSRCYGRGGRSRNPA